MSVYDQAPTPGAALLRYARMKAKLSQAELAERANVPRSMVSAYERDQRQATLPTLIRLLRAAGFDLRMELTPHDDHDEVLAERELRRSPEDRRTWNDYQSDRVTRDRAEVAAAKRRRVRTARGLRVGPLATDQVTMPTKQGTGRRKDGASFGGSAW